MEMFMSNEDKKTGNVVIIAEKSDEIYQHSFNILSQRNEEVIVQARGRHILKALDICRWAESVGFITDNIVSKYIENPYDKKKTNELKITMKRIHQEPELFKQFSGLKCLMHKRAKLFVMILPIALMIRGINPIAEIVSDCLLLISALDVIILR